MKKRKYVWVILSVVIFLFPQCQQPTKETKAKYVFYFIGDGMGIGQINGTEMYLAARQGQIGTESLNFTCFPISGCVTTFSKYHSVTCSAAAGTALATGEKTCNGVIGMDSLQTRLLHSIAVKARRAGKKVGITTSVSIDHATPAAFYAHQPDRNRYYEIAADLPATGFDLYAGAGFLQPKSGKDSTASDVYRLLQDSGYVLVRGMEEWAPCRGKTDKIVFVQLEGAAPDALRYAIDRKSGDLSLAQITEKAVEFLGRDNEKGFFLMIEGGKIDWACHNNDAATTFGEVVDLAEAVGKALEFYRQHSDETLIVLTADHETGGISLGTGSYEMNLELLQYQQASMEELTGKIKQLRREKHNQVSWEDIREFLSVELGFWNTVKLNEQQEKELQEVYRQSFQGDEVKMEQRLYAAHEPIVALAVNMLNRMAGIAWTSGGHTAEMVPVFAIGAGARLFQGKYDNTDIPGKIAEAAGYK